MFFLRSGGAAAGRKKSPAIRIKKGSRGLKLKMGPQIYDILIFYIKIVKVIDEKENAKMSQFWALNRIFFFYLLNRQTVKCP